MTSCTQLLRAAIPLSLVLAAALSVASCASRTHRPAAAGASLGAPSDATVTQQHSFVAATSVPASASVRGGTCWTTSIAVPHKGVYRCLADNKILDPCFPTHSANALACYADPWSAPIYLRLSAALPKAGVTLADNRPWAIQLSGGQRCVAVTGTVQTVGNIALTYACSSGGAAGLVNSADTLRTAFYRADAAAPLEQVAVTGTWLG